MTLAPAAPTRPTYLLPVEAYTDQDWYEREQRELFGRCWSFATMVAELAEVGDYVCVEVGPYPLVVVRGSGGDLRAFHNLCTHRGAKLLEGTGNVRNGIICFYHSWSFALDGHLRRVPQPDQFAGVDLAELGLRPAAVETFRGLVFVHPEPDAPPLSTWLAGIDERMGPYQPGELYQVLHSRTQMKANWKLFIENHIDSYHLWHLHAHSIKGLEHGRQEWAEVGRHWTFYEPLTTPGRLAPYEAALGLPPIEGLDEHWWGSSVHMVFPNLGLAGGATFFSLIQSIPVAPDRSVIDLRFFAAPVSEAAKVEHRAAKAEKAQHRATAAVVGPPTNGDDEVTGDIMGEDVRACEAVQQGMGSPRFRVGPMALEYEGAITAFQRNILDYIRTPKSTA